MISVAEANDLSLFQIQSDINYIKRYLYFPFVQSFKTKVSVLLGAKKNFILSLLIIISANICGMTFNAYLVMKCSVILKSMYLDWSNSSSCDSPRGLSGN